MIRTASRGYSPLLAHPFAEGGVNMDEIFKRGTCRHFKELTPVAEEDLLTLVKAGMQARACGNQEAREFIIVTRDDLVKAISHNSLVAGPARKAGAAIVIVGKKKISLPSKNGPLTAPPLRKTFSSKRNIWVSDQSGSRYIPMLTAKRIF